jgi:hypothetical protein
MNSRFEGARTFSLWVGEELGHAPLKLTDLVPQRRAHLSGKAS